MTRHPYSPATDATPRDADLDPHAHCRAREAAVTRALAAADRLAENCIYRAGHMGERRCLVCDGDMPEHLGACPVAAYLAAREETR